MPKKYSISEMNIAGLGACNMPSPITVPRTRAAFERLEIIGPEIVRATAARAEKETALTNLRNAGGDWEVYYKNPGARPDEANAVIESAEREVAQASAHVAGLYAAQNAAVVELRAAVSEEGEAWSRSLSTDVPQILAKVATAIRMLQEADNDLMATVGMMQGIHDGALSVKLAFGSYAVHLGPAIDEVALALSLATEQYETLKPVRAKPAKAEK